MGFYNIPVLFNPPCPIISLRISFFCVQNDGPEEEYNLEFSIFFLSLLRCKKLIQYTVAFFYSFMFSRRQRLFTGFSARPAMFIRFFCLRRVGLAMPSQAYMLLNSCIMPARRA